MAFDTHSRCLLPDTTADSFPRSCGSSKSTADLLLNLIPTSECESQTDSCAEEDKSGPCSAKARFEHLRAQVKKLSLKCCIVPLNCPPVPDECKLCVVSAHMEQTMKARVADAELEEFSDYLEEFSRRYSVGQTLGEGTTGVVKRCTDLTTGESLVVKVVRTDDAEVLRTIKNEFAIMSLLDHPGIVRARAMYYNPLSSVIYMVQELAKGVELSEYIESQGSVPGTWHEVLTATL